jgi:hypothetical protein
MEKKYFIVTSHGWSASNWVAHSLNLHPDIVCSHSARNALADDTSMHENLKQDLTHMHTGYVSRQGQKIDTSYDAIEKMGEGKYYGSVHLYRLRDLPVVYQKFGDFSRQFSVMNLVRHPVNLVWSGYGQFKDLFRYDINELHWTLGKVLNESREFVFSIGNKYQLNLGDFENLAFIGAACVLGSLRIDLNALEQVKKIPQIHFNGYLQMEKVTGDPEEYKKFISTLLPGIELTENYISSVFSTGAINKHKHDAKKITVDERYATWSDWQKEVFLFYFNKYDLRNEYEKLGYDFSFLPK